MLLEKVPRNSTKTVTVITELREFLLKLTTFYSRMMRCDPVKTVQVLNMMNGRQGINKHNFVALFDIHVFDQFIYI